MKVLSNDIIFKIMGYCKNVNILLNKEYVELIKKYKIRFQKNPLVFKYRLIEYRKYRETDKFPRIFVRDEKIIRILGKSNIGKFFERKFIPSKNLKKRIVPENKRLVYPNHLWGFYPTTHMSIKYDIYDITPINIDDAILHIQLFNLSQKP